MLIKQLDEISIFRQVLRVDQNNALELIGQNSIAAVVIIPEDFSSSVADGRNKPVTVVGNKAMPLQSYVVRSLIQSAANLVSASQSAINSIYHFNEKAGLKGKELQQQYSESTMKILLEALSRNEIFDETENMPGFEVTPAEYFTAALLVVFLMFSCMPAMKMIVTERSYGVSKRLWASPVKTWHVLLSKFIVSMFISAVQFMLVIAATSVVYKNYWGVSLIKLLWLLLGVVFASGAWSLLVSAVSRTSAAADAVGNLGILLMAVIGGSIYPLTSMPPFVREISKYTINRWAMDGFMVIFSGNDAISINIYVQMLFLIGMVMLAAALSIMTAYRRKQF